MTVKKTKIYDMWWISAFGNHPTKKGDLNTKIEQKCETRLHNISYFYHYVQFRSLILYSEIWKISCEKNNQIEIIFICWTGRVSYYITISISPRLFFSISISQLYHYLFPFYFHFRHFCSFHIVSFCRTSNPLIPFIHSIRTYHPLIPFIHSIHTYHPYIPHITNNLRSSIYWCLFNHFSFCFII